MRQRHFIGLLLIIATLTVYWRVCSFDFVSWDDDKNVYNNYYLTPVTLDSVLHFWKTPYENLYIPFTYTIWAMEAGVSQLLTNGHAAAKLNPRIFHTINLFFHILSTLLVYTILRLLLNIRTTNFSPKSEIRNVYSIDRAAGIGALLFAIHPVQVEAVAWVTGMKDLLYGLLSLVAVWQYLEYSTTIIVPARNDKANKRNLHYIIASTAFILAMLSKPAAVVVPFIALALDHLILNRSVRDSIKALIVWVAISIPFIILTKIAQADIHMKFITPLWARPLIAGDSVAFYLYKLVLPIWLALDYGRSPEFVLKHGWIYFTWIVPCGMIFLFWFWRNHWPWLIVGTVVFLICLLPVSGLVLFRFQNFSTVADRYLYLPMFGVSLAFGYFIAHHNRTSVTLISITILVLLGIRSLLQIQYWNNNTTLFKHALEVNPNSSRSHYNLGLVLAGQNRIREAINHYTEALRIRPDSKRVHNNLGNAFARQGKIKEAISHYYEELRINDSSPRAYNNLGNALLQQGKLEQAITNYTEALQHEPDDKIYKLIFANISMAYKKLIVQLKNQKKYKKMLSELDNWIKISPESVIPYGMKGATYYKLGYIEDAKEIFKKILAIAPDNRLAKQSLNQIQNDLPQLFENLPP